MKTRSVLAAILCAVLALLCGCMSILETERVLVTPHEDMNMTVPEAEPTPDASNYTELLEVARDLLIRGQSSGRVKVVEYKGDLDADVVSVREELLFRDAFGSYALDDILLVVTPIVSYWDIQIELYYRSAAKPADSVITISTQRYLRMELLSMMRDYREDAAILTSMSDITVESVQKYLSEIYYDNPLEIAMLPITTIDVYPKEPVTGSARIFELHFAYSLPKSLLTSYSSSVKSVARDVAEAASGDNDAEILLSLCMTLSELSEYDSTLGSLSEHPSQHQSATAYGALFNDSAIGEGYAMAFKALCDSLSVPSCRVVLGKRDGLPYAWNIVSFEGSYYHIDPALCDELGMAEGFFKSDSDMEERYEWDTSSYPACSGTLTYDDIAASVSGGNDTPAETAEDDS